MKKNKEENLLPLLIDITNPSPGIGWLNTERRSFIESGPADLIIGLALIHHLAISNNLPFSKIANFFHKIGNYLIIEFVPKEDSQVQKLLATREDIFGNYTLQEFEKVFSKNFRILKRNRITESSRTIYLMKAK